MTTPTAITANTARTWADKRKNRFVPIRSSIKETKAIKRAEPTNPRKKYSLVLTISAKKYIVMAPARKAITMAIPPELGMGISWDERLLGISITIGCLIRYQHSPHESRNRITPNSKWIRSAVMATLIFFHPP